MIDHYKTLNEFLLLKISDFKKLATRVKNISDEKTVQREANYLLQGIKNTLKTADDVSRETNVERYVESHVQFLRTEKKFLVMANEDLRSELNRSHIKINEWSEKYNDLLKENRDLRVKVDELRETEVGLPTRPEVSG